MQAGAQLTAQGGLMALIAPFVNVAAGATVKSTDQTQGGGGAGSVLYGASNAFTVSLSQETSGDLDMLQFIIDQPSQVTDNPLLLQGTTTGTNVYVASLTASGITGAVVDATGAFTADTASTGQGGEIILSTSADTVTAQQAPSTTAASVSPVDLKLGTVTAGRDIIALGGGDITLAQAQGADLSLTAGGSATVTSATTTGGDIDISAADNAELDTGNSAYNINVASTTAFNSNGKATVGDVTLGGSLTITAQNAGTIRDVSLHSATLTNPFYQVSITGDTITLGVAGDQTSFLTGASYITLNSATGVVANIPLNATYDINASTNTSGKLSFGDLTAGGAINLNAGSGGISFGNATASTGFAATASAYDGSTYQYGPVSGGTVNVSGGNIDLEGSSVYATSLASPSGAVTAIAYDRADGSNAGASYVDIGSVEAYGDVTLTAASGYAALTGLTLDGGGQQNVSLSSQSGDLYLGFSQGSPGQIGGRSAPSGGVSGVGAATPITLSAGGFLNATVNTDLTVGQATGAGLSITTTGALHVISATSTGTGAQALYVSGDQGLELDTANSTGGVLATNNISGSATIGDVTLAGELEISSANAVSLHSANFTSAGALVVNASDVTVGVSNDQDSFVSGASSISLTGSNSVTANIPLTAASGDISAAVGSSGTMTFGDLTANSGSVSLTGGSGGITFATGSAGSNFTAYAVQGSGFPGTGTISSPSLGLGPINAGAVTATNGYIDLEGTDVTSGALTAGATNSANGYAIYAAAWGPSGSGGTLTYGALSPAYSTGQVFLYPTAAAPPPPVVLPVQDTASPFQFDTAGAAPTIGAPGALSNGATGETVTLNARRTLIDWTSYTIGSGGEVDYVFNPVEGQNAANARGNIVLNRITGGGPVDIEGVLTSTVAGDSQPYGGNVWFSAPGGVVFGSGAVVNVGGLLATTAGFSPANLTSQFLDPSVFTFTLDGTGSGYPSGATGFPGGSGYPGGTGYANGTPFDGDVGVAVESGAQLNSNGGLLALLGPYVDVAAGAQVSALDASQTGVATVLYAAAPSHTLTLTQPLLGGDATNGQGDLGFGSLAIGTGDLSGYATPLDLEGATNASNIYAAALSPSQVSGATMIATGALTAQSSSGAGGEIILSTGADTLTAGQVPTLSTASIGAMQLNLDDVTAGGPLRILSSGGINASADPNGLLSSSGGDLSLAAGGDISLASVSAGGSFTATALTTDQYGTFGTGAISANSVTAGGSIDLEGSSVTANSLTAGSIGGPGGITAIASDSEYGETRGTASVDIGSASATGDITLTANDGYASLTSVALNGTGQTLTLSAYGLEPYVGYDPTYLGYSAGGPDANNGQGPSGGVGAISGSGAASGTINLFAYGNVDVDVSGAATLNNVDSTNNTVNLTADSLTITGLAQSYYGINATARTGDLNANGLQSDFGDLDATATQGSVHLTSAATEFYGDLNASALQGSVFVTNASASNIYVTAGQTAHVDNATTFAQSEDPIDVTGATAYLGTGNSADDINVTATNGSATAGDLTALGAITVKATNGAASLHSASLSQSTAYPSGTGYPNTVSVSATGTGADVLIGDAPGTPATGFITGATSITASADRDVTVNVNQPIELNMVSAGRNANLTAPSLTLDALQGNLTGNVDVEVSQDGFTYTQSITAGGSIYVTGAGALTLGDLTAQAGGIELQGASVSAGSVSTGGSVPESVFSLEVSASGTTDTSGATVPDSGPVSLSPTSVAGLLQISSEGQITLGTGFTAGSVDLQNNNPGTSGITLGGAVTTTSNDPNAYLVGFTAYDSGSGDITGSTITSAGNLTVQSGGAVSLGGVTAQGYVSLQGASVSTGLVSAAGPNEGASVYDVATTGAVTATGDVTAQDGDVLVSAPGQVSLVNVTSQTGSVTLTGGAGVSFGTGSANQNFVATSITGSPGSGSGPGSGTGSITATGDVTATNGYVDLEGANVSVGNMTAGGVNPANNDYIYAAAWGDANGSPGALSFSSTSPNYVNNSQVFLYPAPPPPSVPLPVQDTASPFQFDTAGAAPTIGAPGALSNGNFGETVTLNARRTLIDWTSYTIGSGGEVDYVFNPVEGQNAANARGNIVLNRITGGGPVDIEGVLTSTVAGDSQPYGGNVWFSAPGGVVFGSGAVVNVGGLLATTAGLQPRQPDQPVPRPQRLHLHPGRDGLRLSVGRHRLPRRVGLSRRHGLRQRDAVRRRCRRGGGERRAAEQQRRPARPARALCRCRRRRPGLRPRRQSDRRGHRALRRRTLPHPDPHPAPARRRRHQRPGRPRLRLAGHRHGRPVRLRHAARPGRRHQRLQHLRRRPLAEPGLRRDDDRHRRPHRAIQLRGWGARSSCPPAPTRSPPARPPPSAPPPSVRCS